MLTLVLLLTRLEMSPQCKLLRLQVAGSIDLHMLLQQC